MLVQVDLAGEATKDGAGEEELPSVVEALGGCERLRLRGLMTLPPFFEEPERARGYFRRLRELRDELSGRGAFGGEAGELSMGMSHDFETAVEEARRCCASGRPLGARAVRRRRLKGEARNESF